jgi:hypothetical protein
MAPGNDATVVELDSDEVALIIGENDGAMSVRVIASGDMPTEGTDMPAAPEIVVALAARLLKDPDFHDDVLDWFYAYQDDTEDEEDEEDERG